MLLRNTVHWCTVLRITTTVSQPVPHQQHERERDNTFDINLIQVLSSSSSYTHTHTYIRIRTRIRRVFYTEKNIFLLWILVCHSVCLFTLYFIYLYVLVRRLSCVWRVCARTVQQQQQFIHCPLLGLRSTARSTIAIECSRTNIHSQLNCATESIYSSSSRS